jgi:O-acetyl-ADP-ribose deacetylase (regulator of RNase III)
MKNSRFFFFFFIFNIIFQHHGGIAADISKKAGDALIKECKDIIAKRNKVPTGTAVTTTAGNLPFKFVYYI